jgi:hypothetical protein
MVFRKFEKKLDDIATHELTLKAGKYAGYAIEAGGVCGIVYGICTGDNYTTASSGFVAYFGTIIHRSFGHLQITSKDGTKESVENERKTLQDKI